MKKLLYRLVTGALLLCWMCTIFRFSAQPAVQSEKVSGGVAYRVVEAYCQIFHVAYTEEEMEIHAEAIDYPIRKAAHMTEYAVLGIYAFLCLIGYEQKKKIIYPASLLIAVLYATSDEIHQLYVPGRAGRFSDVCIDMSGAALGLLLVFVLQKIWEMIAKRRSFHYNKSK